MDVQARVSGFMKDLLAAMGLSLAVQVQDSPDGIRIDLSGDGGEVLLRRKAEALEALQQIVNTGFRRDLKDDRSFVVDCMGYRRAKDTELREMARFIMQKAKTSSSSRRTEVRSSSMPSYAPRSRMEHASPTRASSRSART